MSLVNQGGLFFRILNDIIGRVLLNDSKIIFLGVGVADVVEALVHHVGIATVGVRVTTAATKKDVGYTPAQKVPQ